MSFQYFQRYGDEGTTGRFNAPTLRGNYNNEVYIHTAKNETRSWITPTPTPTISITPSITPSISVTPTITVTPSITPSITITPTISTTPTVTPSYVAPDLTKLSLHISQLVGAQTGYSITNANGTEFVDFGFGADQTGNWHQVTYPGTTKTAWVKEEDKTTFSGNGHVTGIYSVETTSVSGQDVLIMRGKVAGETLAFAGYSASLAYNLTDPTKVGANDGTQKSYLGQPVYWRGIRSGDAQKVTMASHGYAGDTPLGYRTGSINFVSALGNDSRLSHGFKIGDFNTQKPAGV